MQNTVSELNCCCLSLLSRFVFDGDDPNEPYQKSRFEAEEKEFKGILDTYNKGRYYLAVVNSEQKHAKAMLKKEGFSVLCKMKSNDNGRVVYLMSKNLEPVPREKRGLFKRIAKR